MDGNEVLKVEQSSAWGPSNYSYEGEFDGNLRRIVIKCLRPGDQFRFNMLGVEHKFTLSRKPVLFRKNLLEYSVMVLKY